jgi:sugar lactone lactonase YvrE
MPVAMTVDAAGNVYVGNTGGGHHHASITEYAAGSKSVSRTITGGLKWPGQLALDGSGDLFVANQDTSIIEYAPNSARRLRTLTKGIAGPIALAVDSFGKLYVGNTGDPSARGWISVYAPGASSPLYKISDGVNDPVSLALDGDDNLYVANQAYGHQGSVTVYPPNAQQPARSVESGRYGSPKALALGPEHAP